MLESASMDCARVTRGTRSIESAVIFRSARMGSTSKAWWGEKNEMQTAPCCIRRHSSAVGRATFTTMSALPRRASDPCATIEAPADE
jgi:hypothetical protein